MLNSRKLNLRKETLSILSGSELEAVAGGSDTCFAIGSLGTCIVCVNRTIATCTCPTGQTCTCPTLTI